MAVPPLHPPAEVRPGCPALHPDRADDLTALDALAWPNAKPGLVQVGRDQALAVVDHRQPALVVESGLRKADPPGSRSQDRRSPGRREVGTEVRGHGLAVEDALASKAAGHPIGLQRRGKSPGEIVGFDPAGPSLRLAFRLRGDFGEQGLAFRFHLLGRKAIDALDVKSARRHRKPPLGGPAICQGCRDLHRCGAVPVQAYQEDACRGGDARLTALDPDPGAGSGPADEGSTLTESAGQMNVQSCGAGGGRGGKAKGEGTAEEGAPVSGGGQGLRSRQRARASPGPA